MKDDYIKNVGTLEGEWEKMHDHLSGMRSRQPEVKKEYKSGYQSDYWKIRVIPESLSAGGAEITFAKLLKDPAIRTADDVQAGIDTLYVDFGQAVDRCTSTSICKGEPRVSFLCFAIYAH